MFPLLSCDMCHTSIVLYEYLERVRYWKPSLAMFNHIHVKCIFCLRQETAYSQGQDKIWTVCAFLRYLWWVFVVEDYKNLTLMWGADRKNPSEGHCLVSRGFAEWCQPVNPRNRFFYPHRTTMIDSFSCISEPEGRIFLSAPNNHYRFFFLHQWTRGTDFSIRTEQPWHPPSLTRVFAVRMKKAWGLSNPLSAQRRLWSDGANFQADLSLRWAHTQLVGFVMSRFK